MTKLLQQCFLFFIVVVILGHNLGNSQVSVYRTIGPTLVTNSTDVTTHLLTYDNRGIKHSLKAFDPGEFRTVFLLIKGPKL